MAEARDPSGTVHATAVLIDGRAVLLRGPAGAGKSQLALRLIAAFGARGRDAALIGDDRVRLEGHGDRLVARAVPALAGLLEVRGHGIVRRPHEAAGVVALVVDLGTETPERLPEEEATREVLAGVAVPRLALWQLDQAAVERIETVLGERCRMGNSDRSQVRS